MHQFLMMANGVCCFFYLNLGRDCCGLGCNSHRAYNSAIALFTYTVLKWPRLVTCVFFVCLVWCLGPNHVNGDRYSFTVKTLTIHVLRSTANLLEHSPTSIEIILIYVCMA